MNVLLFDNPATWESLLPLTYTRPISHLRIGILTIAEKWERLLNEKASVYTAAYLQEKYPPHFTDDNYWINGAICPHEDWIISVKNLKMGEALMKDGVLVAARTATPIPPNNETGEELRNSITYIDRHWKIVYAIEHELQNDFRRLTSGRKSQSITDPYTRTYAEENIFIEEGVTIRAAILNASAGPIYLAKNAVVGENSVITGPVYIGENAVVKPLSHIRANTVVGTCCVVSGEVSCSMLMGFSNKAHAGYLGHSVVGEWCNMGAGTSVSNMKNNYDFIKVWNHFHADFEKIERQFSGLIMGDHSKCGIHTMFNSGTVVGVSCNIFGSGFPSKIIPSFSWGGQKMTTYQLERAIETARRMMSRRELELTKVDEKIFSAIFSSSEALRRRYGD